MLSDWRFAQADLAHGEYVLALQEIAGTYIRSDRALPSRAVPLIRDLAEMIKLDSESPIHTLLGGEAPYSD